MEPEVRDNDIYGLVTGLCKSLYRQYHQPEEDEHPYLLQEDHFRLIRKLRCRAYEILLNKSSQDYGNRNESCDPIVELLKYAYILKVGKGRLSQAAQLQKYLDEFIDNGLDPDSTTYATLQFLNELKSFDFDDESTLDIFHYGKPHPQLPEMVYDQKDVPPFQIYPAESFYLPKKFELMFKQKHNSVIRSNVGEPGSNLALLGRFTSTFNNIQNITYKNNFYSKSNEHKTNLFKEPHSMLQSCFVPQLKYLELENEEQLQVCKEGIVTEPESPWQSKDTVQLFGSGLIFSESETKIYEIDDEESEEKEENMDKMWENVDKIWENVDKNSEFSNHRTWETLGSCEPPKEPPFVSECAEATLHLVNVAHDNILPTLIAPVPQVNEVPVSEFISNMKLLLLGVESSTFKYYPTTGFGLKKNVAIHGISPESLENMCFEITSWGTCYRNLANLIVPDPQTGKLQIEGLIFKALCGSIKEFLVFYRAAVLRVSIIDEDNPGPLQFLSKLRQLGKLILKVAGLCRCDSHSGTTLGEGIGILTHIYEEVTKVTEQNVALVFYSILKDCCEIYFRFLQQWIFEGVCTDIYEEFMIKVRPQYVRTRGHRFWTRAFSINKKLVPGFISELADSILQCGKAVTLLKMCDPQNPLCRMSVSSQPPVRVCLSVGMLREQVKFYEEYVTKGEIEQGKVVSISSAIEEQKEAEKIRADLVIAAQQNTLTRLKKEREDARRKIIKEKSEFLTQLKDQAEAAALRKERDRDAELLADKLLMEKIIKLEEDAKNTEKEERENTIKYYNELAEEAKRKRIHTEWRIRRMKLFDERIFAISDLRKEFINTPDTPEAAFSFDQKSLDEIKPTNKENDLFAESKLMEKDNNNEPKEIKATESSEVDSKHGESSKAETFIISKPVLENNEEEGILSEDENSNPISTKMDESSSKNQNFNVQDEKNQNLGISDQQHRSVNTEQSSTKAIRPTVLDITSVNTQNYPKDFDILDGLKNENQITNDKALNLLYRSGMDNMTQAQRNKLKVLQQEYGVTPNNNESTTILFAMENSENKSKITEVEMNRLRNTQHITHLNWKDIDLNSQFQISNLNKDETNRENTEIETNRLRNTQHLTHLNWEGVDLNSPLQISNLNNDETNREKTEIETNRLRNTQHLTHLNWEGIDLNSPLQISNLNNDETNREKTEIETNRLRNTQHLTHLNWEGVDLNSPLQISNLNNDETNREKTEIETNRLRNTQHLTHLNWDNIENQEKRESKEESKEEKTEIQINRLRNMQHLTHLNWNEIELTEVLKEKGALSDAEINRNKVMSSFYDRMNEVEAIPIRAETLTEWQKNRNKNLACHIEQFNQDINRFENEQQKETTPMSTTTDHFTTSTYSSCMQIQSSENTPFSEITNHSDMLFTKSSDGTLSESTWHTTQSRKSKFFPDTPSFPNFIGFASVPSTPSAESLQLTVADVEMIDTTSLQVFLKKSVIIPLSVQSRLVNNAIIKYLVNQHNMLSHLHSLRSYYFLLNGEFAKTLMKLVFTKLYAAKEPKELFNSSTLTNFLEKALVSSLSTTYANSELLSLSAITDDVPTFLQTSNPEILSCLSLKYKISWPLNIIFNDIVLQQYSRVFKFLLMVGRVLWVLQEDFHILKIERKASITKNHHKLQLYRYSMMQFMNALHTYLTCSVLHASWSEFEKELEKATTLDEVYDTHVSYIKKILSRCMLNTWGEKMRKCLCNIFKVVLKFHNRIRAQKWTSDSQQSEPNYENLEKMYIAFCEQRAYLAHVAEKLANSGYQPHLMQFLHALNINHRYDLTSKK